jgi:hypothetical protein
VVGQRNAQLQPAAADLAAPRARAPPQRYPRGCGQSCAATQRLATSHPRISSASSLTHGRACGSDQDQQGKGEHGAEAALPPPSPCPLASRPADPALSVPAMAATVLVPPAHCHRSTAATTSGRGGAGVISHCTLPPARRRRGSRAVRAAAPPEQSGVSLAGASGHGGDVKAALYRALEGVDRGIFGMTSAQRSEVHRLVELLESRNPTPEPTAELREKVREQSCSWQHLNSGMLIACCVLAWGCVWVVRRWTGAGS